MIDLPTNIDDQISCIAREIALRTRVYGRQVAAGKMNDAKATHEINTMMSVLETLKKLRDGQAGE
jgi:hypothetical protein